MLKSIFGKSLRDSRTSLIGWSIGMIALVALIVAFYPAIKQTPALNQLLSSKGGAKIFEAIRGPGGSFTSPEGYLQAEIFGLDGPLLFLIFGLIQARSLISGEEREGTMMLLLAGPKSRSQIIIGKYVALVSQILTLGLVTWLSLLALMPLVHMSVSGVGLAAAITNMTLLVLAFATIVYGLSAWFGPRVSTTSIAAVILVISFFLNNLAPMVQRLKLLQKFSLFYYASGNNPLVKGFGLAPFMVFGSIIVVFLAMALYGFKRRDITG